MAPSQVVEYGVEPGWPVADRGQGLCQDLVRRDVVVAHPLEAEEIPPRPRRRSLQAQPEQELDDGVRHHGLEWWQGSNDSRLSRESFVTQKPLNASSGVGLLGTDRLGPDPGQVAADTASTARHFAAAPCQRGVAGGAGITNLARWTGHADMKDRSHTARCRPASCKHAGQTLRPLVIRQSSAPSGSLLFQKRTNGSSGFPRHSGIKDSIGTSASAAKLIRPSSVTRVHGFGMQVRLAKREGASTLRIRAKRKMKLSRLSSLDGSSPTLGCGRARAGGNGCGGSGMAPESTRTARLQSIGRRGGEQVRESCCYVLTGLRRGPLDSEGNAIPSRKQG
ncbi:Hypothetical protein RMP42_05954 [Roseomonas mucosa]|nr:Hypothetical protein RMP42_05954 [Roseomonas mucosa]